MSKKKAQKRERISDHLSNTERSDDEWAEGEFGHNPGAANRYEKKMKFKGRARRHGSWDDEDFDFDFDDYDD